MKRTKERFSYDYIQQYIAPLLLYLEQPNKHAFTRQQIAMKMKIKNRENYGSFIWSVIYFYTRGPRVEKKSLLPLLI